MQDYCSLYDEVHSLLWDEHKTSAIIDDVCYVAIIMWDLDGPIIEDIHIDKDSSKKENHLLDEIIASLYYSTSDELDSKLKESPGFISFTQRILNVEKDIKEAFKESGRDLYKDFIYHVEGDPNNNKESFLKSFAAQD